MLLPEVGLLRDAIIDVQNNRVANQMAYERHNNVSFTLKGLFMHSKKNIIFIVLLCAQGNYIVAVNPAETIAQAMKESAAIQAEALKDAAPQVGLESAKILASALVEASPKVGLEAAHILASAFYANSNEAINKSSNNSINFAQTTVGVIKGLIAVGAISACVYIAWPKLSGYFFAQYI
jgi:hypothetical protein